MSRASLDKDPHDVARMFDAVGKNYDLTNTVLSFGQDALWRKRTRRRLDLAPGDVVLDLAAGTGVSTEQLAESGAWCVACDFSQGMLAAGRDRNLPMVCGDGMQLPFPDNTFDRVTIAFGIGNFENREKGLREMLRVLKPGGRLVILELSRPENKIIRWFYDLYFLHILPKIGGKVSGDKAAYAYLPTSVAAFPGKMAFLATMRKAGFRAVTHKAFTLGICRMYTGEK